MREPVAALSSSHDAVDGILHGKHYLLHDRDPLVTADFQSILANVGVTAVKLPPQSPNLNAYAKRFVRSIKESSLDRPILFGGNSLRTAVREFVAHYLRERRHQGLGSRLIPCGCICAIADGAVGDVVFSENRPPF